jgi:hypothetical protein
MNHVMRTAAAVVAVCGLAVIAGCGGTTATTSSGPVGYLHVGRNLVNGDGIDFLQWGAPGPDGNITGTLTVDANSWTPPAYQETIGVDSVPFTGQIHGSSITLHLGGKLAGTFLGTVTNGTVTLSSVSSTGLASTLTLHKATMTQYNSAVTKMRQAIKRKCASASGC